MTQKVIILVVGYFALGIFTFTACVTRYEATICDIQFTAHHYIGVPEHSEPDNFDDEIGFAIRSKTASQTCYRSDFQVFNSAYATTKCAEFQNQLLISTYRMSFDKPFVLNNDTISANTELLSIPAIAAGTDITVKEDCDFVDSRIIFSSVLTNQMQFETGEYEVTFTCSTSDGRNFTKTRRVIFAE